MDLKRDRDLQVESTCKKLEIIKSKGKRIQGGIAASSGTACGALFARYSERDRTVQGFVPNICGGLRSCVSSFDDRPGHFIAPWTYEAVSRADAVQMLARAVRDLGGDVQKLEAGASYGYIYVTWTSWQGTDDVEFLLSDGDNTVVLRSAARVQGVPDLGRNEQRLEQIRLKLGWEEVPILRNRRRALFFVESPWDSFGPVPPTDPDYRYGIDLDESQ